MKNLIIENWSGCTNLRIATIYKRENDYDEEYQIIIEWESVPTLILRFDNLDFALSEFKRLNEAWLKYNGVESNGN